jgi:DNA-binding Lrp family transcriptional regulator
MALDDLDRRILKELLHNSNRSYRRLASELNVAPGTILNRIKELESQGIIKNYSIVIDHKKLDSQITAIIEITTSGGKLDEMERKISRMPNIYGVYNTTGSPDAIIIGTFKDTDDLGNFTKSLLGMHFVGTTNTHVVLKKVKEDFRLPV